MQGTIKWFNNAKGYGFVIGDDGQECFVHYSKIIAEGFKTLTEGDRVTYEVEDGEKGKLAINVKKIEIQ